MSKNEKGFYIFFDWLDRLKELASDESMKIIQAIGNYYRDGTDPTENFDGTIKIVVALMFDQIKRGESKAEEQRQKANARWKRETISNEQCQAMPSNAVQCQAMPNDATYNNITDNNITNNSNKENTKEKRKRFLPPSLEEVREYCYERQNNVNASQFIDFYTANGWKVGKNSMKDWKAAVRTWERNGIDKPKPQSQKTESTIMTDYRALEEKIRTKGLFG